MEEIRHYMTLYAHAVDCQTSFLIRTRLTLKVFIQVNANFPLVKKVYTCPVDWFTSLVGYWLEPWIQYSKQTICCVLKLISKWTFFVVCICLILKVPKATIIIWIIIIKTFVKSNDKYMDHNNQDFNLFQRQFLIVL